MQFLHFQLRSIVVEILTVDSSPFSCPANYLFMYNFLVSLALLFLLLHLYSLFHSYTFVTLVDLLLFNAIIWKWQQSIFCLFEPSSIAGDRHLTPTFLFNVILKMFYVFWLFINFTLFCWFMVIPVSDSDQGNLIISYMRSQDLFPCWSWE